MRVRRGATRSPFLCKPSGRHAPPSPLAVRVRPGVAFLPRPGFASAYSRLFALAPPESFTCAEAAAEAGPSLTPSRGGGLVASGRPRHSYNCFRTLKRGVSFSPGRCRACPEARSVGAQAKLQPRSFGEELESPGAESARGARPGIVWQKESTCCLRHSPVVLAKAALVEFSFRYCTKGVVFP